METKYTGHFKKAPKGKIQEVENLNGAFKFMQENNVKLINIGPTDVHDGNLKLILGVLSIMPSAIILCRVPYHCKYLYVSLIVGPRECILVIQLV